MRCLTKDLVGHELNVAVNKALNLGHPWRYYGQAIPNYCNEWKDGGPIIEREKITVGPYQGTREGEWQGYIGWDIEILEPIYKADGPTPLIAAMRCYVASKLGDVIDISKELA